MVILDQTIDSALALRDAAECNRAITECHYGLSKALLGILGQDSGVNFHSWAVWGSKKAGVTVRQEDLHQAREDAMRAGGVAGLAVGIAVARLLSQRYGRDFWYGVGSVIGPIAGSRTGEALAIWSRRKAAKLVLQGNNLVLNDIGRVTARFCARFADREQLSEQTLRLFTSEIEDPLLRRAFEAYGRCALANDRQEKHEACYLANCLAILYEHQKLQPMIKGAMPLVVRRCVTKRLLSFEIGSLQLAVSKDVPSLQGHAFPPTLQHLKDPNLREFLKKWDRKPDSVQDTAASDWTLLEHRMAYILDLFRRFHTDSNVLATPYPSPH